MASAADLSGKHIKFSIGGTPVELEIINGSVSDQGDVTSYLPTGTNRIKRSVGHGSLITWTFSGVLITTNFPWAAMVPTQNVTGIEVECDRTQGTPDQHESTDGVVVSMVHSFDTSNHQVWDVVLQSDGHFAYAV